jgi:hypothetical protein
MAGAQPDRAFTASRSLLRTRMTHCSFGEGL